MNSRPCIVTVSSKKLCRPKELLFHLLLETMSEVDESESHLQGSCVSRIILNCPTNKFPIHTVIMFAVKC